MPKRILIVDDNQADLQTMQIILEKNGFAVTVATNGERALKNLAESQFDLLIVDVLIPVLTGYELVRLFREKEELKVKLMFASIAPKNEIAVPLVDGVVQKPFSPETLVMAVKKQFGE